MHSATHNDKAGMQSRTRIAIDAERCDSCGRLSCDYLTGGLCPAKPVADVYTVIEPIDDCYVCNYCSKLHNPEFFCEPKQAAWLEEAEERRFQYLLDEAAYDTEM